MRASTQNISARCATSIHHIGTTKSLALRMSQFHVSWVTGSASSTALLIAASGRQACLGVTPEINAASTLMILAVVICLGAGMLAQSHKAKQLN